jgi:hypothetical protein
MVLGLRSSPAYSIAAAKVAPHEIPAAICFINIAQIGSVVIALTISEQSLRTLLSTNSRKPLAGKEVSVQELRGALAGTQSAIFGSGTPEVRAGCGEGYHTGNGQSIWVGHRSWCIGSSVFFVHEREKLFMKVVLIANVDRLWTWIRQLYTMQCQP